MINVKELRLGNIVKASLNEGVSYMKVVRLEHSKISLCALDDYNLRADFERRIYDCEVRTHSGKRIYDDSFEKIEPIPLTEELLLKCGFENYIGEQYDKNEEYACNFEYQLESGIFYRDLICKPYDGMYVFFADSQEKGIKYYYLHQLQNIYFYLTGKELEVKL